MTASGTTDRLSSGTFHAVTHVWGREYLDVFLNVCIPNQLAPGNVPALPPGSRYRILTRSIHVDELNAHPMVRALRDVIPVDILVIEALERLREFAREYQPMNACHQRAIADILDANAAIIMLSADVILSEDALAAVVRRHRQGYRAVVNAGLRLAKRSFVQALEQSGARLDALSSRELIRVALPHLHPHTLSMFADAAAFSRFPSAVYWRVGSEGVLARCFHLHPLMVDPVRAVPLEGTYDDHYLAEACPDFSRVHVVTDSDELQMFELTTIDREFPNCRRAGASVWQAAILAAGCDELQLRHWREHPVYLHTADISDTWGMPATEAERFARRVIRRRAYSSLARRWLRWADKMDKRRVRYAKVWYRRRRRLRFDRLRGWTARRLTTWDRRRPRIRLKQIQRPAKIWTHRLEKSLRVKVKRMQRRVRPLLSIRNAKHVTRG